MRFFIASIETETNTFSPIPTGLAAFEEGGLYHGNASLIDPDGAGVFLHEMRRLAEADGHEVVESICASAEPGGVTVTSVYESFRDELLGDLAAALPVDAVQLFLHGAMVADGYPDCEGNLLSRIRDIVGPDVPVGAVLDLHCHATKQMLESADALIALKEYPHTDALDRISDLYRILRRTAAAEVRPVTAVLNCRMVGVWPTVNDPMAGIVKMLKRAEQDERVLSVSLGHGFPWGDVPEAGAKVWVITDGDLALAETIAGEMAREFWSLRHELAARFLPYKEAIASISASSNKVKIIADVSDNPGGGAAGDSTFVLSEILRRGLRAAVGAMWDPAAVAICAQAGVGSRLILRVGGKAGPASGNPLDVVTVVKQIESDHRQAGLGQNFSFGQSAWVQTDEGTDIVLTSRRVQALSRELFSGIGIDLDQHKLIMVKSMFHFLDDFRSIPAEILFATSPAALPCDFARINYKIRDLNYWPRVLA